MRPKWLGRRDLHPHLAASKAEVMNCYTTPQCEMAVPAGFAPASYGFRDRCNDCYTTGQCEMAASGGLAPPLYRLTAECATLTLRRNENGWFGRTCTYNFLIRVSGLTVPCFAIKLRTNENGGHYRGPRVGVQFRRMGN